MVADVNIRVTNEATGVGIRHQDLVERVLPRAHAGRRGNIGWRRPRKDSIPPCSRAWSWTWPRCKRFPSSQSRPGEHKGERHRSAHRWSKPPRLHISELTTAQEVLALPLEGRNALNVIAQTPGVTGSGLVSDRAGANDIFNAANAPSVTANGQRGSSNGFYVDDTSVNDNPDGGSAKLSPNVESIQEVRVSVNNYSAQYGRNSSVLTQITTKSGTNQIHGSLFEYHTDNKLTARNVFQNTPNPITGRIVPVSRRNEFGGSMGLPIRKDHTFVFASYDQLKVRPGL